MSARRCTARSKRTGERCGANAVTGREVCYHHGGKTPRGIASPHYKTGRYSCSLPVRLAARYEHGRSDPELLKLADEVALVDARVQELLARLGSGGAPVAWERACDAFEDVRAAIAAGDERGTVTAAEALGEVLMAGRSDGLVWAEVVSLLERRARFVVAEQRRVEAAGLTLRVEEALALAGALVAIVRRHVRDPEALAAISRDAERLLSNGDGGDN